MRKLITKSDVSKALGMKGFFGECVGWLAMRMFGFNKVNELFDKAADYQKQKFTETALKSLRVTYDFNQNQLNNIPKEGPFIIVSNHPFGAIEGIILYDVIARIRPDFKVMANFLLSYIPNLKEAFFSVNPFTENKEWGSSHGGIKGALLHLGEGHGLGIFPAGEVSRFHGHKYPEDISWSISIAKMIKKANVPVVPMFFEGRNSRKFYRMAKIHSLLGTVRLPMEIINKHDRHFSYEIGKPVLPAEIASYDDPKKLAAYLRSRSYALEANLEEFAPHYRKSSPEPIDLPRKTSVMIQELESIRKKSFLFTCASYDCYLADYKDIPNLMHEIGRRREEAFRAIGEGSGKRIDTDEFDEHYKHLILWDNNDQKLAGGYRLGFGNEIMENYGLSGAYVSTLFNIDPTLEARIKETIELGRSFVSIDYQKDVLPLMLLLKGLLQVVVKYENMRYFVGPVSISNWYPKFYQSLMVYYISKNYSTYEDLAERMTSKTPFVPDFMKVDVDALMAKNMDSIDKFDRFMMKLSQGDYRMPTLFKKYLKLNAKFLCFNVDPDFNTLDGLLFLDYNDIPKDEIMMLVKDNSDEEKANILKRFGYAL